MPLFRFKCPECELEFTKGAPFAKDHRPCMGDNCDGWAKKMSQEPVLSDPEVEGE